MRIQHNIMAMNAYRNYNTNTSALAKNLEKLSSGYKINRAGDDAAGLAISEKMRAQITGLNAAQKNVKDGISLVKTAEGAMQEVQDMLNRMEYLATQSANGTYDNEVDRANLQKEVTALKSEINRIADSANFNGIKLLDGSLAGEASTVGGANGDALDMLGVNNSASAPNASKDGVKPTEATGAEFIVTLKTGGTLGGLGSTSIAELGSGTVADLFTAYDEDGNEIDLTDTTNAVKTGDTMNITLVAKKKGELSSADLAAIKGELEGYAAVGTGNVSETNGTNIGDDVAGGTRAVYTVNFKDLSAIHGGDKFVIGNKTFEFDTGKGASAGTDATIDISDLDLTTGGTNGADYKELKKRILDAVKDATDGLGADFKISSTNSGSTNANDFVLKATSTAKGIEANGFKDPQDFQHNGAFTVDFKPAEVSANPGAGQHTKAVYTLGSVAVGDKITIGDKTIEIIDKYDDDPNKADLQKSQGKLTLADFKNADELNKSLQSMGYKDGRVSFIGSSKIAVEKAVADDTTAEAWSKGLGKVSVTKASDSAAADEVVSDGKGLTLQIGDTADAFNQLKVAVGDMHTKALGIDDLDISNIEGAQKAIQTIKDSINNVSSVRGDLGAIQNRLEHTANNLSVMAENIQDAESTIRDTDVAEEMMKYTKNNILIQSAQAMLAQANAVPQGVLQLLG